MAPASRRCQQDANPLQQREQLRGEPLTLTGHRESAPPRIRSQWHRDPIAVLRMGEHGIALHQHLPLPEIAQGIPQG